jgi:hypothetical protein
MIPPQYGWDVGVRIDQHAADLLNAQSRTGADEDAELTAT